MEIKNIITLKDDRTGRTYAMQADSKHREYAIKKLQEKMDYEYFESLPAEQRIDKKVKDLDFTCPTCIEKTEVSSRKEKMTSGFFLFFTTRLVDIYKCHKCENEFTEDKLSFMKELTRRENNVIANFENWKDGLRTYVR